MLQNWDKLIILFLNNKLINVNALNFDMLYCLCSAAMKMYCELADYYSDDHHTVAKIVQTLTKMMTGTSMLHVCNIATLAGNQDKNVQLLTNYFFLYFKQANLPRDAHYFSRSCGANKISCVSWPSSS